MNHASQAVLDRCQFTSPFLQELMSSSVVPESIPYSSLCGNFLNEYRDDTGMIPCSFSSDSIKSILSLCNAFPPSESVKPSKEEQKRRQTRRRSSLLMYRQSFLAEESPVNGDSDQASPEICSDDDDNGFSAMDFICSNDYGDEDDNEVDMIPPAPQSSKIQWDSVFTDPEKRKSTPQESDDIGTTSVVQSLPTVDWTQSSYGYATIQQSDQNVTSLSSQFTSLTLDGQSASNMPFNQSTNAWAGANHWKSKLQTKRKTDTSNDEKKVENKKTSKRSTKAKFAFNFDDLESDVSEFIDVTWESSKKATGKAKSSRLDPRLQSDTILKKQQKNAKDLLLPEDQKIERRDLYR